MAAKSLLERLAPNLLRNYRRNQGQRRAAVTSRGYVRPGGGTAAVIRAPKEWRGSTRQVCGMWPFAAGSGAPLMGVPIGPDLVTGNTVALDMISAFTAKYIQNPSTAIFSLPGMGKSTLVKHLLLGHDAFGFFSRVLGDIKGEYDQVIEAMGGVVIPLGPGRGNINPLDPGEAYDAAKELRAAGVDPTAMLDDLHSRQRALMAALITITRKRPLEEVEDNILDLGIRILRETFDGIPLIQDLLEVIESAPDPLRQVAMDRGEDDRYRDATEPLCRSLRGMISGGVLGTMFSKHTTRRSSLRQHASWNLAAIGDHNPEMQAAAMLATWSAGYADVNVAHALADAGIIEPINYVLPMDEFWKPMSIGRGLVEKADTITRLNRNDGIGQYFVFHTLKDFEAIADPADRKRAMGFIGRCGIIISGGQREDELEAINKVVRLSKDEERAIVGWGDAQKLSSRTTDEIEDDDHWEATSGTGLSSTPVRPRRRHPGEGKFLIKVGATPGVTVDVRLTPIEQDGKFTDTNSRWKMQEG